MDPPSENDDDDDDNQQFIQEILSSLTENVIYPKSTLENGAKMKHTQSTGILYAMKPNASRQHFLNEKDKDHHHLSQTNDEKPQIHRLLRTGMRVNATNYNPQTPNKTQEMDQRTLSTKNTANYNKITIHNIDTEHKNQDYSPPYDKPSSSPKIKQIDEALETYYASVGVHNYFDSNGIGKFSAFIEREAFDVDPSS
eukprot:921140_1